LYLRLYSTLQATKFLSYVEVFLNKSREKNYLVAVIGAGPAGLYASQYLARQGVEVVLFNREIKPGGLVEYGIYPSKHKLRLGLLAQFRRILEMPKVHYLGNIIVGQNGDIEVEQLREMGFDAFMVTTGAQSIQRLTFQGKIWKGFIMPMMLSFITIAYQNTQTKRWPLVPMWR